LRASYGGLEVTVFLGEASRGGSSLSFGEDKRGGYLD